MATPLASLILLLAAGPAWAAPCPVPYLTDTPEHPEYAAGSRACNYAVSLRPLFDRLQRAADVRPLRLRIAPDRRANAYFEPGRVVIYHGALLAADAREEIPFILAHEIGHAVQFEGPEQVERNEEVARYVANPTPEGARAYAAFKRRHESQADAIAIQLLSSLGYSQDTARRGMEAYSNCSFPDGLSPQEASTHPTRLRRLVNLTLGAGLFSDATRRVEEGGAEGVFGLVRRPEPARAVAAPLLPRPDGAFEPAATLDDFREDGTLLLGRVVARRRPPAQPLPPYRPPVTETRLLDLDVYARRAFIAAVNRRSSSDVVAGAVMQTCGRPEGERAAFDLSPAALSRRATAALTR